MRPIVKAIRANPMVVDADLISLGVGPRPEPRRREIPAPETAPLLTVVAALDGYHMLRVADSLRPDVIRKPPDVNHLMLYMAVAQEVVTNPALAPFNMLTGKPKIEVYHERADNGKQATYFGRWSTRTGLLGPWSLPVSMTVSFVIRGGVQ